MDLIMLFKITHYLVALNCCSFFGLTSTTCHIYELDTPISNNNARQLLFACRRIYARNKLHVYVVNALSLTSFENLLQFFVSISLYRYVKVNKLKFKYLGLP